MIGILSVKCSDEKSRLYVTDIFLGLAVSTMLGDTILHIIPIFLGIHKHEEEGHEGKTSTKELFEICIKPTSTFQVMITEMRSKKPILFYVGNLP